MPVYEQYIPSDSELLEGVTEEDKVAHERITAQATKVALRGDTEKAKRIINTSPLMKKVAANIHRLLKKKQLLKVGE